MRWFRIWVRNKFKHFDLAVRYTFSVGLSTLKSSRLQRCYPCRLRKWLSTGKKLMGRNWTQQQLQYRCSKTLCSSGWDTNSGSGGSSTKLRIRKTCEPRDHVFGGVINRIRICLPCPKQLINYTTFLNAENRCHINWNFDTHSVNLRTSQVSVPEKDMGLQHQSGKFEKKLWIRSASQDAIGPALRL